jgi:phage gpG-like protein
METNFEIADGMSEELGQLRSAEQHINTPITDAAQDAIDIVHKRFKDQGPGWAPHKDPRSDDHPLLMDTMHLYDSIQANVEGSKAEVFSDCEYSNYQDQGTSTIPARPFLYVDSDVADEAEKTVGDFLFASGNSPFLSFLGQLIKEE